RHYGLDPVDQKTFLLLDEGRAFNKGDAALQAARHMWQPWPLARVFRLLPRPVRDGFYDLVAKYRYRVFGKRDSCMVPQPEHAGQFL
ncbi:MAG TPA: DCC1-like thiol-disulfide oxidoreductase family protein, partial [Afifellaceae bacterium]|nr:DCC1-like thiol-disulfide oxidoreductase family protein [Afifellaceae bacterium]